MKENDLDFEIEEDLVKLKSLPKFLSKQKTVFFLMFLEIIIQT